MPSRKELLLGLLVSLTIHGAGIFLWRTVWFAPRTSTSLEKKMNLAISVQRVKSPADKMKKSTQPSVSKEPGEKPQSDMSSLSQDLEADIQGAIEYPPLAAKMKWQGAVMLEIQVNGEGKAAIVNIIQSSGYDLLDQHARQAALNWQYPVIAPAGYSLKINIVFGNPTP